MGRKKLEIKRIEENSSRQVTFCKQRNGLIEKARQLSVLCDASVGLLVVSASDKLYSFSSGDRRKENDGTPDMVGYEEQILIKDWRRTLIDMEKKHADDLNALDLLSKSLNYSSHHELLELVESKLVESIVDVSVDSLVELEDHLETALSVTRARKAELMLKLVESLKEKEENQILASQIEKKKLEGGEADNIEMSSGQNLQHQTSCNSPAA
ncbi:BnaC03g16530D [Brassica napus]|uniref:BnaC03g16530D protein n=1 Tax=Brassica napus TaxID=3708 RepID=A0A078GHF3_BRANA|nr:BnaC03g16530D [Brassica napus]